MELRATDVYVKNRPTALGVGSEELLRICSVPLFVTLCYQFDWHAWRSLWVDTFVKISFWWGVSAVRVSFDSFVFQDTIYRFVTACTALDAFFGSIPLLWKGKVAVHRNLSFLAIYFICLSIANLIRLELGFVLYLRGVSWFVAHEVMAGIFYFVLFLWIVHQRGWDRKPSGSAGQMALIGP